MTLAFRRFKESASIEAMAWGRAGQGAGGRGGLPTEVSGRFQVRIGRRASVPRNARGGQTESWLGAFPLVMPSPIRDTVMPFVPMSTTRNELPSPASSTTLLTAFPVGAGVFAWMVKLRSMTRVAEMVYTPDSSSIMSQSPSMTASSKSTTLLGSKVQDVLRRRPGERKESSATVCTSFTAAAEAAGEGFLSVAAAAEAAACVDSTGLVSIACESTAGFRSNLGGGAEG